MSFSKAVKDEVAKKPIEDNCCIVAELAGLTRMCGNFSINRGEVSLSYATENSAVARRIFTHLKKYYSSNVEAFVKKSTSLKKTNIYIIKLIDPSGVRVLLDDIALVENEDYFNRKYRLDRRLIKNYCCKKSYIAGSFLGAGSITNPERNYHVEFITEDKTHAEDLSEILSYFGLKPKVILRKNNFVVYLKEAEQISDFLSVVGANRALLEFENIRVLKDMRNNVNRIVNCETANLNKIVDASLKQVKDIELIDSTIGIDSLKENLREVAQIRLEYRDIGLKEIGEMLDPPVGKSGVNHRLKKIREIADSLRRKYEEQDTGAQ